MPQNNNLEPIELPMDLKFGEPANTKFQNNLKHEMLPGIMSKLRGQILHMRLILLQLVMLLKVKTC